MARAKGTTLTKLGIRPNKQKAKGLSRTTAQKKASAARKKK